MTTFLEELSPDPATEIEAGTAQETAPAGTETEAAGGAGPNPGTSQTEETARPAASPEELAKAQADAAYWRGVAEGRLQQGGNGGNAVQPLTEEQIKEREAAYLADPYGENERMIDSRLDQRFQQFVMQQSVNMMQREANDYHEVIQRFSEMCKKDPSIGAQLVGNPDPARWAYNLVKQRESLAQYDGDPKKLEESIRKRVREEVEEQIRKELALEVAGKTPPTPAGAGGSGGTAPAAANIPDALDGNPFD